MQIRASLNFTSLSNDTFYVLLVRNCVKILFKDKEIVTAAFLALSCFSATDVLILKNEKEK